MMRYAYNKIRQRSIHDIRRTPPKNGWGCMRDRQIMKEKVHILIEEAELRSNRKDPGDLRNIRIRGLSWHFPCKTFPKIMI